MTAQWDGHAPAEGWWWIGDKHGSPFPAQYRALSRRWFSMEWSGERAEDIAWQGYTLLGRCEPPGEAAHPDDVAVDRFAVAMKEKLARKRAEGRGGWEDKAQCSKELLSHLLREHVEKGDPIDIGNLAMMLHQRGERAVGPSGEAELRGWKACQEAAASIADKVSKKNDTGSGFDSQPAYVAAASIARAIRSLTPPKDEPA